MVIETSFFCAGLALFGLIILFNHELSTFYKIKVKPLIDKAIYKINMFFTKTYSIISNFFGKITKRAKKY